MFSFLGELLCLVAWLIGRVHEALRRVCSIVPALLVTDRAALRKRVNSCDASWLASVARWWGVNPRGDRLLANRLLANGLLANGLLANRLLLTWVAWRSSASLVMASLPSRATHRN